MQQSQAIFHATQHLPVTAALRGWAGGAAEQIARKKGYRTDHEERRAGRRRVITSRHCHRTRLVLDIARRLFCFYRHAACLIQFTCETSSQIFDIGHLGTPVLQQRNISKVILFHQKTGEDARILGVCSKNTSKQILCSKITYRYATKAKLLLKNDCCDSFTCGMLLVKAPHKNQFRSNNCGPESKEYATGEKTW
ncbi:hypothetical protein GGD55_001564 [Rhizobium giardinii]|uniref:Uncharacterized protein n=1 Tax=Rhizobium giardinii TaxID=56731 RepID=A0A7W8U8Q5_9HYPH|nr:hypothetical protein [Rhizobium giardinii]